MIAAALCWHPEARLWIDPHVHVLMAERLGSTARMESVGDLREADDETDHHQAAVLYPGSARVDAPEVLLRAVGDPQMVHAEAAARFGAAQEDVRRASVDFQAKFVAWWAGGRHDYHDHLAVAGRVAERAASLLFLDGKDAADVPAHDRDLDTADLGDDWDHDAKDPVAKAMYAASVEG